MTLTVNGDMLEIAESSSALDLINLLGYKDQRIALEVNQKIIPKSSHAKCTLLQGDSIEIITAVGGG
jgi:sulfur carrier protein